MNKLIKFASAGTVSMALAASVASPAYAWHPQGQITKSVQNVTAGGAIKDANDASSAVSAKPGDILNYVIIVKDIAAPASNQYNDMAFVKVTDKLPAGLQLVSTPNGTEVDADMGTITPGNSKEVSFKVKVTSTTDGALITNEACYTADSVVHDKPIQGCDTAVVKVNAPAAPTPTPTPAPSPTPTPSPTPAPQPAALPNTGAGSSVAVAGLGAAILGYGLYVLRLKRRAA